MKLPIPLSQRMTGTCRHCNRPIIQTNDGSWDHGDLRTPSLLWYKSCTVTITYAEPKED